MTELLTAIAFLIYIGYLTHNHNKHVRDLELKIISKNLYEYRGYKETDSPSEPSHVAEPIDEGIYEDIANVDPEDILRAKRGES